jgi:hypothetical protein
LIEKYDKFSWAGLRTATWKYVEYSTGEKEFYDLVNDPYEEESLQKDPAYQDVIDELANRLDALKGLAILLRLIPRGSAGEAYEFQFTAWGGEEPYSWEIFEGELPEGLSLDSSTGIISGIPIKAEEQEFSIKVEDSSIARQTGQPQAHILSFSLIIE